MLQKTELHTLKRDINTSIASVLLFKKNVFVFKNVTSPQRVADLTIC